MSLRRQNGAFSENGVMTERIDARSKIIAKKREKIVDAREKLSRIVGPKDARTKLNAKRNLATATVALQKRVDARDKINLKRSVASSQVKKVISNATQNAGQQVQAAANRTRVQGNSLVRTVSGLNTIATVVNKKPKVTPTYGMPTIVTGAPRPVQRRILNRPHTVVATSVVNTAGPQRLQQQFKRSFQSKGAGPIRPTTVVARQQHVPIRHTTVVQRQSVGAPSQASKAIFRPAPRSARPLVMSQPVYSAPPPTIVYRREPQVVYEEAPLVEYEYVEPQETIYYEEREPTPEYEEVYVSRPRQQVVQELLSQPRNLSYATGHQRPSRQPAVHNLRNPHAVRSAPSVRASPPVRQVAPAPMPPKIIGHKVVVGNLHPVATSEDIEELFGNIGPISSCKMSRPGCASVVFTHLSDAQKSVEVYHNRKLDGQPMQVKIVGSVSESGSIVTAVTQPVSSVRTVRGRY